MACACSAWAGAVREQGGEKKKRRRKKGEGKKRKRRKKGDAGGIHGVGREPSVASMRSDAHEK